jgi:YggT family protein
MNNALADLIHALFNVACFLFLARFILQASRADFYNPVSQGIVKVTDPILRPLRIVIKGFRNFDIAAFLTAWFVQILAFALIARIGGDPLSIPWLMVNATYQVLDWMLLIYVWALILLVVISWISPGSYNPMAELVAQVTEPLLAPVRRLMPPVGGIDFSVMVVILMLTLVQRYLLPAIINSLFA